MPNLDFYEKIFQIEKYIKLNKIIYENKKSEILFPKISDFSFTLL